MSFIKLLWFILCILLSLLLSVLSSKYDSYSSSNSSLNKPTYTGSHEGSLMDELHSYAIDLIINESLDESVSGGKCQKNSSDSDNDEQDKYNSKISLLKSKKILINNCSNENAIIGLNQNTDKGLYSNIPKCLDTTSTFLDRYKPSHAWYKHKTWKSLFANEKDKSSYLDDINVAYYRFYFNWVNVFNKVVPFVKNEPREAIGIIKCEDDGKTLYVDEMEVCNHSRKLSSNSAYDATIHPSLVTKYFNIPCYFIFHTHPKGTGDPWPSDNDIEILLEYNYHNRHLAHVVISEYGAIIYFLNKKVIDELRSQGKLMYYTFCYDLLSAWNSYTFSAFNVKNSDLIDFMSKFGLHIIVVPSPLYISESYRYTRIGGVLVGRFIHDRDKVLVVLKNKIKELEKLEEQRSKLIKKK